MIDSVLILYPHLSLGLVVEREYSNAAVATKIQQLERKFKHLHRCTRNELMKNLDISIDELLQSLTLLPIKLKKFETVISQKLPSFPREGKISEFFLHLNYLLSFVDYSLLEYIIEEFGSENLNKEMHLYSCEVRSFMKQTTIQQLIDFWPRAHHEVSPYISEIIAIIKKDPQHCYLNDLDNIRKDICIHIRLTDVISGIARVENFKSFVVVWSLPSILAPNVVNMMNQIEEEFFEKQKIALLFVDTKQIYPSITNPQRKGNQYPAIALQPYTSSMSGEHKLWIFATDLRNRYQTVHASVCLPEWNVSPMQKNIKLALIQGEPIKYREIKDRFAVMTITGRVDDILHQKTPIEIESIFKDKKHGSQQVILIEGAPGIGKSTLTIHIRERWGKGELFQQFMIVILVQLGDPAVQRAQSISDLLPSEDVAVTQELATELLATNGRGVLWVLDGWDELSPNLQQDSIFRNLVTPQAGNNRLLDESSVIVTSRPISSGDLHPVVSSRIEVLGFTPEEQKQYFTECLKEDTKALEVLLERIQENPVVQSICYLPFNAALTLHYFKCKDHSLPSTKYEFFDTIIINCVQHYLEQEGKDISLKLKSLDDLLYSEEVGEVFRSLCELAYHGVMENKVTFSSSDLPQGSNTLSLLQEIESFLQSGKSVFYSFFHHGVQEALSAIYIARCLPEQEQVSQFQQLFCRPHLATMFQFYSAITKLKTTGIAKVVSEIFTRRSKPNLISLLHCIFEAQDPSLCQLVTDELPSLCDLYLTSTSLSPRDCLNIGYFISMSSNNVVQYVSLSFCGIDDVGVSNLTKFMCGRHSPSRWRFAMLDNNIHEEGAARIAEALQSSNIIYGLRLHSNPIGGKGLQSILEALITNSSLVELDLSSCSLVITEVNGPVFTEMLYRNNTLEDIDLSRNRGISETGIFFIAEGLKKNNSLKCIRISDITAQGGKALAGAIATNTSLASLDILTLKITQDSGSAFVDMLQKNTSLKHISFTHSHGISDVGVSFIAKGLLTNCTLQKLNLYRCEISSTGTRELSKVLMVNKSLTSLDISSNPIGDNGIAYLAEALKVNRTLKTLSVRHCKITDTGLASLTDALQFNNTLRDLDLDDNYALTESGMLHFVSHKSGGLHVRRQRISSFTGVKSEFIAIGVYIILGYLTIHLWSTILCTHTEMITFHTKLVWLTDLTAHFHKCVTVGSQQHSKPYSRQMVKEELESPSERKQPRLSG